MIRKAAFVFRLAGQDLRGNLGVHLVAVAIITAAFLTLGLFALTAVNLRTLAEHWQEKIQVIVYLDEGLEEADLTVFEAWLKDREEVSAVEFVSKDRALSDFREMLGDDDELLEGLEENPLPASFIVSLEAGSRGLESVKGFSSAAAKWPAVEEVDYGGKLLEGFDTASSIAQAAVLLVGGLIMVAVIFIISNTVRLTMYSRSEEIGIMKLVGASGLLIRMPFILEGMLQGVAAAVFGALLLYALYRIGLVGVNWPGVLSGFKPVFLSSDALWMLVLGGGALGAAGSISKVRDFTRA